MEEKVEKYLIADTIPIGKEFWYWNRKYRVEPRMTCRGCYFEKYGKDGELLCRKEEFAKIWGNYEHDGPISFGHCTTSHRLDHTAVIFRVIADNSD